MQTNRILNAACGIMLAVGIPAQAQAASATTLSGKEVPLRIHAQASVMADEIAFTMPLEGTGETKEAAEAALAEQEAEAVAALVAAGLDSSRYSVSERTFTDYGQDLSTAEAWDTQVAVDAVSDEAGEAVPVETLAPIEASEEPASGYWSATSSMTVTMSAEEAARTGIPGSRPEFTFVDRAKTHREAVAQAMANARSEAEEYAAAMGHRVVRVAGVSNAGSPLSAHELISMIAKIDKRSNEWALIGSITAQVTVDYVIAPN